MIVINIKPTLRQVERKMRFLPEYFYCERPTDKAPVRILVSGMRYRKRGLLRTKLRNMGFVVKYWQAKFKAYG